RVGSQTLSEPGFTWDFHVMEVKNVSRDRARRSICEEIASAEGKRSEDGHILTLLPRVARRKLGGARDVPTRSRRLESRSDQQAGRRDSPQPFAGRAAV